MPAVRSVLVVGAGAAGCATAILLAQAGVDVEIVESRPEFPETGSGITLQGNALRVLRELGVWEPLQAAGYAFDSVGIRAPGPHAPVVAEIPDVRTGGPDLPATLGVPRPVLARLLLDRATAVGAKVSFDTSPTHLTQDADGVVVSFSSAADRRFDLVVGADGIHSWTRRAIDVDTEPRSVGMGIWRAYVPRPADVVRTDLTYGGRCYIAGYCPTGPDEMYAYLVEDAQDRSGLARSEQVATFRDLASSYHGPWDEIRESLGDDTHVNYARFEHHVVDGPWHRGNVVLVGDAAHSCPPTIAQGAALALEDAAVLAELLVAADVLDDELLTRYATRRAPRARAVVEASVQIAEWMLDRTPPAEADVPGLMRRVSTIVTERA
ncbi:2-polyprenyl-6-methoxyphenol hydroxylase-like FAD-dependent oxidoreductase [Sediminihabitans luteus]|uniref:2-polyprenyl-6-methoxyphenol hydroxylase-like FAD-dependent oxidoreductase n=1 Tax=Sediminihabitans luteus TaxID=1138585 RepID=A0A2M9CCY2_9CELL|nr:FAD-dependent monooxygenase [Sediminihabitans luteus]PJJ69186.1 2-polyprenyl-6-methoxyphenol hydroxylase-like FAD-dependent oxidoreductase [Sediminihabitans luteus]GII98861.1 FAD-dependent oxidoreductase [Sediminihabitans luteus]